MALAAIGMLVAAIGCGCRRSHAPHGEQAADIPASPNPASARTAHENSLGSTPDRPPYNVILIIVDGLRADMPWAGYPRDIAPRLDEFRRERCVTYLNGYAISSYTAKSVAPALVGEYPSAMSRDGRFFTRFADASNVFISELARRADYRTLAGHARGYFLPRFGLNQGFDDYRLLSQGLDSSAVRSVTSETLTALAIEMLSDPKNTRLSSSRRFFAYFHYMDPRPTHELRSGHSAYGPKRRDLYDGEVSYTDFWIGKLLDYSRQQPWWPETAVIITADHGEGLGERGQYGQPFELWESLIRVPWLICTPHAPARTLTVRRSHIDLAPTIADLMEIGASSDFRGKSLVPEALGQVQQMPRRVVADLPRCDLMDRRRALIDGDWKIIAFGDDTTFMLFDLAADPWEERDLSGEQPHELERMKRSYAAASAEIPLVEVFAGVSLKGAPVGRRW